MPQKDDVPLKEKYRLWWEYLKRSKDYNKWTIWVNTNHYSPTFRMKSGGYLPFYDSVPKEFMAKTKRGYEQPRFLYVFNNFGDVFNESFDNWWNCHQSEEDLPFVFDYLELIVDDFKRKKKREPSIEEFKEKFIQRIQSDKFFHRIVLIPSGMNNKKLFYKIVEVVKEKMSEPGMKEFTQEVRANIWNIPIGKLRFPEVKRYLQVYDLRREGKKWREVAKIVFAKLEWNKSLERALHIDFKNAEAIIKNVEQWLFPGKY